MRRRFEETILQQEGGIAAHQPVHAMEEETAQIGGRRKLADLFDIALPAQQRRGPESAVFGAVIDVVEPVHKRSLSCSSESRLFGIEVGQKLFAHGTEEAFDLAAAFGLIGTACAR